MAALRRDEIPDAIDNLHHAVSLAYGEDSGLCRAMRPLYALACKELVELEEAEKQVPDEDEFRGAHAAVLRSEAKAIRMESGR